MRKNLNDLKRFIENKEVRNIDNVFVPATIGTNYVFEHPNHSFFCVIMINEFNHVVFKEVRGISNKNIDCMYYHADEISKKSVMYKWLLENHGYNIHFNVPTEKRKNDDLLKFFIDLIPSSQKSQFKIC